MNLAEQTELRNPLLTSEIDRFVARYDPQTKIGTMARLLASNFGDLVSIDEICVVWGVDSKPSRTHVSNCALAMLRADLGEHIRTYRLATYGDVMLAPTMHEGNWYTPAARKALIPKEASPRTYEFLTDMLTIRIASGGEAYSLLTSTEMSILLDLASGVPVTNQGTTLLLRDKIRIAGYDDVHIMRKHKSVKRESGGYYYLAGSILKSQ